MTAVNLLQNGEQQFFDDNGDPLALGTVTFYVPNSNTLKATWADPFQNTQNTNPVNLDAAGRAIIWGNGAYRQLVKDHSGNTIWDQETITLEIDQGTSGFGLLYTAIPSVAISVEAFAIIGNSAAGDSGVGTWFSSVGATAFGLRAVQDLNGTYFNQVNASSVWSLPSLANYFWGPTAGNTTMSGNNSVVVGANAYVANTTGQQNTAVGINAMAANTTGEFSVAVGFDALASNTTGIGNVAIGNEAMQSNTTGNFQVAVGDEAMHHNTTGNFNVAVGTEALRFNTTGSYNTGVGQDALRGNTTGQQNTAVGNDALFSTTDAIQNVAIGHGALFNLLNGNFNVVIGESSLGSATAGGTNTVVGQSVLPNATSSDANLVIGYHTGGGIVTGGANTIIGNLVNGLAADISGNVIIADGFGNKRLQHDGTGWLPFFMKGYTCSTLPALGVNGAFAYVNDGDPGLVWGALPINSGGGTSFYFVVYIGGGWTVMGKA